MLTLTDQVCCFAARFFDIISMMKCIIAIVLVSSFYAISARTVSAQSNSLPPALNVGTPYAIAREDLMRNHARPITSKAPSIGCAIESAICRVYPELDYCSLEQHLCRFEWLAADGRQFTVITAGNHIDQLFVQRELIQVVQP